MPCRGRLGRHDPFWAGAISSVFMGKPFLAFVVAIEIDDGYSSYDCGQRYQMRLIQVLVQEENSRERTKQLDIEGCVLTCMP